MKSANQRPILRDKKFQEIKYILVSLSCDNLCTFHFRNMANSLVILFFACFVLMMTVSVQTKTTCFFDQRCGCKTTNKTYVEVDCSHVNLSKIPFLPRNVSSVDLSNNNISNIPEHHFKDNDILTEINLSLNRLHSLNTSVIARSFDTKIVFFCDRNISVNN